MASRWSETCSSAAAWRQQLRRLHEGRLQPVLLRPGFADAADLRGFGIDTILFYHGIQPSEAPSEFIFEGADGTRLFASRMGSNARYNFFFSVYRPAVFGKETLERDYHWQSRACRFISARTSITRSTTSCSIRSSSSAPRSWPRLMERLKQAERQHATTDHICCMQGMDSTQPDVYELQTARGGGQGPGTTTPSSTAACPNGWTRCGPSVRRKNWWSCKGERRTPRQLGTRVHLYGDVTSARVRIKQKNARAEQELQRKAEPLAAVA